MAGKAFPSPFRLCALIAVGTGLVIAAVVFWDRITWPQRQLVPQAQARDLSALTLDAGQREYLWQIEHHGNVLSKHGFQPLAAALSHADAKACLRLLATDFVGSALEDSRESRLATKVVDIVRRQSSGHYQQRLNREQFADVLFALRAGFRDPPKVKLSLMSLSPTEPDNLDGPWQGTCLLRMWGEKAPGSPCEVTAYLAYQSERPTEDNLNGGSWLQSCAIEQVQVAASTRYLFREATAQSGLDGSFLHDNWVHGRTEANTGGVYVCDYNRDGILDILLTDVNGYALYQGLAGRKFKNVTTEVGLPPQLQTSQARIAAFMDVDGDGWDDLILSGRIYRNDNGRWFVDATGASNLRLPRDGCGIAIADYDRDGRLDIYVTRPGKTKADSWLDGKSGDPQGNQLWRNLGGWRFQNVTDASGTDGGSRSTFSAVWLDADSDGWPDLYIINEFGDGVLLVNKADGTFREQLLVDGPCDFGSMGVTCGDVDNDGNIDLYVANMYSKAGSRVFGNLRPGTYPEDMMAKFRQMVAGSQLHMNRGKLKFEQVGTQQQVAAIGWAYGPALADLDNDGWLDLYATAGFISTSRTEPDG